ncbi:MAG: restriction endonuclease subunit S [Bacteroidales bacterium]|nr:restriction endonuclease subunit S [Bacteroidales bacterium]MDD6537858.1 restriction endonuclease subunit S [Bacteroidales bacterium]
MTQRYDTYKDSGVQWLGEIPGHGGCVFINRLFNIKAGGDVKPELYADKKDENHPFPVYTNTKSADDVYAYTSLATCPSNSITVTGRGEVGHAIFRETPYDAIVRLLSLTPKSNIICKFYAYFIDTVIPFSSDSAAIGQLSAVQIKQKHVTLPPLSEQRSIVSFLDAKCGKIDEWVTKKQKEVEHLQELKQRVIADAVTRGLNPHVKMKATNIPWLKEIPEHWECVKLKMFCQDNKEKNKGNIESCVLSLSYGNIIVKKNVNFGLVPENYDSYQIVNPGNIILRLTDLQNDHKSLRTGLVKNRGIITSAYVGLIVKNMNSEYTQLILHSYDVMKVFYGMGGGLRQSMSYTDIANVYIPVPPLSEQKQIVSYLDTKTSQIDKLIAHITKEIECIKEYKQRLISDVVTGQIKVC